ncbi:MAG: nitrogenase component 1 [Phascolarctobacterium sp.]|nr:nitrogenase component 1 [Phascolarctobacterium sp.]
MKALTSCALFGATRVLAGITDAIILQHSVAGCNYGTLSFRYPTRMNNIRQASTIVYEENVICGGAEILAKGLHEADTLYKNIKTVFVISGCVPNLIGDDIEGIIADNPINKKVIHVSAPGYSGTMEEGSEVALVALAKLVKEQPRFTEPSVNIFGIFPDDPEALGDMLALEDAFGGKVAVNFNTCFSSMNDIEDMGRVHLNICLGCGEALARELQNKFGTEYICCDYPYGINGMVEFLTIVGEKLGIGFQKEIARLNFQGEELARRAVDYLENIYQLPAMLVVDRVRFSGLKKFLQEELGMYVTFAKTTEQTDLNELMEEVSKNVPALICASSFVSDLARERQVPLLRIAYPVVDEVSLNYTGYLGARGFAHLLEKIINASLQMDYKKNSLFPHIRKECTDEY